MSLFHLSFNCFMSVRGTTTALIAQALAAGPGDDGAADVAAGPGDDGAADVAATSASAATAKERAAEVAMQSLLLSVGVGFLTAAALLINGSALLKLMGLTGDAGELDANTPHGQCRRRRRQSHPTQPWHPGTKLMPDALSYLTTRAVASPAFLAIMAMEGIFRGHGDTRAPLAAALVAAVTNLLLDPLLMFGPLRLGLKGAAAATAVAQYLACATYVFMLHRRRKQIAIATPNFGQWRRYLPVARRILAANGALLLRTFGGCGDAQYSLDMANPPALPILSTVLTRPLTHQLSPLSQPF